MMHRRVFVAVVVAGLLAGCQDNSDSIAVIPKGTTHEHWKSVHAGAEKAAKEFGVKIIWKGPLREDDRQAQVDVVETMVARGVKGILLAPLDDTALVPPVEDAAKAKIPVITFDSALKSNIPVSYVATDNRKGGAMAGEYVAKLLKGKGRVILLRYMEGSASTIEREEGFLEAMSKSPDIQIVSKTEHSGATVDTAQAKSEQLISRFKQADGKFGADAIFTVNESATFGMANALSDAGLAGKVIHMGFDASPKLVEMVRGGKVAGLVIQDPITMGYQSVKTMVDHLHGKEVPKVVDTGVYLVTPDSLNDPKIKSLLESRAD